MLYPFAVPVDLDYPNLRKLHTSPDVYLIKDFLSKGECESLQAEAQGRGLTQSPVK